MNLGALFCGRLVLALGWFVGSEWVAANAGLPGLPEPGIVAFGRVLDRATRLPVGPKMVTVTVGGGGDLVTVAARVLVVNGATFYVINVPFETRSLGGLVLERTPNRLSFPVVPGPFLWTATFDGKPAAFGEDGRAVLELASVDRGRVVRWDLFVDGGGAEEKDKDSDGDGALDWAELVSGTDPKSAGSVLRLSGQIEVQVGGGLVIEWEGVAGRTYVVQRSMDPGKGFSDLAGGSGIRGTEPRTQFLDRTAVGPGPYFYRVSVR